MFFHYSEFPFSLRMLYTATLITLGLGYAFAMIQIYTVHAGLDGNPGLNANDIAIAYTGNPSNNPLTIALTGKIGIQIHGGANTEVRYKNLMLKEL